jgi:phosphoserine phosphatase RsbU/P
VATSRTGSTGALTRLTAVSRALTYAASLDDVLEITVDCAADLLDAPRVVLMLRDDEGLLRIRAALGCDPAAVESFREPLEETLITRLTAVLGPEAAERFLGVPLVVRGGVIGLLAVLRPAERPRAERDEWLLSALADQASVALENARGTDGRTALEGRVRELERRDTQREEALRMIGHDLRSPLSALNGYLHLLQMESYGPLNDAQRATVERLLAVARHVDSLVNNVAEMGRLAMGTLDLRPLSIELGPLADAAADILRLEAQRKGVEVRVEVPPDLRVRADPDRLRQVLVQLLDNAVKFAPEGTAVRLEAEAGSEAGSGVVVIRVVDQGPGVPADEADAIFEPYQQGTGAVASPASMGLGLAIARALVDLMDGTIALDPAVPQGATFLVRLPGPGAAP